MNIITILFATSIGSFWTNTFNHSITNTKINCINSPQVVSQLILENIGTLQEFGLKQFDYFKKSKKILIERNAHIICFRISYHPPEKSKYNSKYTVIIAKLNNIDAQKIQEKLQENDWTNADAGKGPPIIMKGSIHNNQLIIITGHPSDKEEIEKISKLIPYYFRIY
ncbi:hypothetical protein ABGM91_01070 [Akkermansia muciniphila]|uniref:hypothetical protein n=1 Tax=Akkermansia muciniphila TaxID=239935 RepID=UPI0033A17B5F